ncbi:PRKR-interacting protein 1 homolog [Anopheles bellator]|uniref:PRKR-interacting protein 1 homolog n=1 Tax=Anopheles bellator TaxID=139047 RepID=UPI002647E803|nr:PRKR-interacting protein 1 homolog [Anopheles bellator]
MEIRNEVKQSDKEFEKKKFVVRNAADVQRAKLEKLMKNPDKPVMIPTSAKDRDFSNAIPSFVRNVMGSSAGAGSGEFHVYRHLRRKEYARQKHIQEKSRTEQLDDDFQAKLEQNRQMAEDRTAKKRAKRQKRKAKQKANHGKKPKRVEQDEESSSSGGSDTEENDPSEAPPQSDDKTSEKEKEPVAAQADDTDEPCQPAEETGDKNVDQNPTDE